MAGNELVYVYRGKCCGFLKLDKHIIYTKHIYLINFKGLLN